MKPVISADSHVLEPHDLWTTRMAGGPFEDRAPHMVQHDEHGHLFIIDGLKPFPIGLAGAAGKSSDELHASGDTADTLRSGGWDPAARLVDMDTDGVAAEVLYPSIGMTLAQSKDLGYQLACIEAYNDWLVDYCAAGDGRLVGLAMIPTVDPVAAVGEIERCAAKGLRGAMVPGAPAEGHYAETRFDPMWAAFTAADWPVSFHILTGGGGGDPTLGSGLAMLTVMDIVHQVQQTLALLIFGRVFDRHPRLKVVSAEHDAGWVAHYAYRLDQMWERHHNWLGRRSAGLERQPSEYLRDNAWFTFQKDPVAVETRDRVGIDRLMWASDYPHSDSTWPHSLKVIERDFAGIPEADLDAIVHDNAVALYKLQSGSHLPELIEIEVYRRLAERALRREIASVSAPDAWFLKGGIDASAVEAALTGEQFTDARRIGKLLLLDCDGVTLGLRFGMTGRLIVDTDVGVEDLQYASRRDEPAWDRFAVTFVDGGRLRINDARRLGGVLLDPDESRLGADAATITRPQLAAALVGSDAPLKARLMDQNRIAGLGNLLTDEVLWRAGLDPARPAGSLDAVEVRRLHHHVRKTVADLTASGGSHTGRLQPARERGGRCPRDGAELLRRTVGGRTTYSCPVHQR